MLMRAGCESLWRRCRCRQRLRPISIGVKVNALVRVVGKLGDPIGREVVDVLRQDSSRITARAGSDRPPRPRQADVGRRQAALQQQRGGEPVSEAVRPQCSPEIRDHMERSVKCP